MKKLSTLQEQEEEHEGSEDSDEKPKASRFQTKAKSSFVPKFSNDE